MAENNNNGIIGLIVGGIVVYLWINRAKFGYGATSTIPRNSPITGAPNSPCNAKAPAVVANVASETLDTSGLLIDGLEPSYNGGPSGS